MSGAASCSELADPRRDAAAVDATSRLAEALVDAALEKPPLVDSNILFRTLSDRKLLALSLQSASISSNLRSAVLKGVRDREIIVKRTRPK